MTKTINELTVVTSAAAGDFLALWRATNGDTRKITKANFLGAVFTGAGTIATGGFSLTLEANSILKGTVRGNISGDGTLATGGNTLTLTSSGMAATLDGIQTFTAVKGFTGGINFGQTNLDYYEYGTWSPLPADAATGGNTNSGGTRVGTYVRIGRLVFLSCTLASIVTTGLTGANTFHVQGMPFAANSLTNFRTSGSCYVQSIAFTGYVTARIPASNTAINFQDNHTGGGVDLLTVSDLTSAAAVMQFGIVYTI